MRHSLRFVVLSSLVTSSVCLLQPVSKGPRAIALAALRDSVQPSIAPELSQDRRHALQSILGGSLLALMIGAEASSPSAALALDMDAFVDSQLEADTKNCDPQNEPKCIPKLTADEALCVYGHSGQARGEACMRITQAARKRIAAEKKNGGKNKA